MVTSRHDDFLSGLDLALRPALVDESHAGGFEVAILLFKIDLVHDGLDQNVDVGLVVVVGHVIGPRGPDAFVIWEKDTTWSVFNCSRSTAVSETFRSPYVSEGHARSRGQSRRW